MNFIAEMMEKIESWDRCKTCYEEKEAGEVEGETGWTSLNIM